MTIARDILGTIRRILRPYVRGYIYIHDRFRQRTISWKMRFDPSGVTFSRTEGRARISNQLFQHGARTAVILGIGASNLANEGDPFGAYDAGAGVYNFNFLDGRCYAAKDPLLGASMDRSNLLTRLGRRIVATGDYDQVLLVPIAHGGTYIREWVPGGRMYPRLDRAIKKLRRAKIDSTHILWQQGEAEANQECTDRDGMSWALNFSKVVEAIRSKGFAAPIYVARSTVCHGNPCDIIRKAQLAVIRPEHGIFAGPDLDTIGMDQRWDGCHFSGHGMDIAAELWYGAIEASRDFIPLRASIGMSCDQGQQN
jgi:hypothetical protein